MRKGEKREIEMGGCVPILLEQPHCVLSIPPNALWPSGQMFSQQKWLTAQNGAGKISVQRQQRARELLEKWWRRLTLRESVASDMILSQPLKVAT